MRILFCFILAFVLGCSGLDQGSQGTAFNQQIDQSYGLESAAPELAFFEEPFQAIPPAFNRFPSGAIRPSGWILQMMETDLNTGIVGALDELYPGIKEDDLYASARRGGMEDIPEMGDLVLTGADWEKSIMWWNAETIGNWWDGFVRHAFLTDNKTAIKQADAIAKRLLDAQDEDGYIGIYKPNLRYQHEGSNGELWAQTTAFRTLLAYYEYTKNPAVLEAVERGMDLTMKQYGEAGRNPFYLKNAFGGVTHGLMITDVCETLHRISGEDKYLDYATYLYKAFSTYSINRAFNDLRYPFLMEKDSSYTGHAVHTYEHIRSLVLAYQYTGFKELGQAMEHMLYKLDPCLLPGGAGHGAEWIAGLEADPSGTASEYCSMLELRNSFGSLFEKTGEVRFADAAEKLTYNGMLGARNRTGTAIAYSKHDNCYIMNGKHHHSGHADPRFKYSPTHSEPAVCCVPNYGRNLPYFLDQMYMQKENGLAVVLYGPSVLKTKLNGSSILLKQETTYPLSDYIHIQLHLEEPSEFTLFFRKPEWAEAIEFSVTDAQIKFADGFYQIHKIWSRNEKIELKMVQDIQVNPVGEEVYLQRGPLVFAYEIPHREELVKPYSKKGFSDYYCYPLEENYTHLLIKDDYAFDFQQRGEGKSFYDYAIGLEGLLFDSLNKQELPVVLRPMGTTVLRKVSFPTYSVSKSK